MWDAEVSALQVSSLWGRRHVIKIKALSYLHFRHHSFVEWGRADLNIEAKHILFVLSHFCGGGWECVKVLVHSKDDQLIPVFKANGCIMGTSSVPCKPDGWSSHFIVREMCRVEQKVIQRRREESKTADKNPFPGQNSWKGKQCRGANASLLTFIVTAK